MKYPRYYTLGILAVVSLIAFNCHCSNTSDAPFPNGPGGAADTESSTYLSGAPRVWPSFLAWTKKQLKQKLKPATFPANPGLPKPGWPVLRLEEVLEKAQTRCDWTPAASGPGPLVRLGPFQSDKPAPGFNVKKPKKAMPPKRQRVTLQIGNFSINCEDVGELVIEIRLPAGRHFDLVWSRGGRIRIPVPDNRKVWPLHITTDGLPDWSGSLRSISLVFKNPGPAPIEIRSLRFLGREESFLKPVGTRRVTFRRETRTAIYSHGTAEIRFPRPVIPARGYFQAGLGVITADGKSNKTQDAGTAGPGPVQFEVLVEKDGQLTSLVKRNVGAGEGWLDIRVPLHRWRGPVDALVFKTLSSRTSGIPCWGNPAVYGALDNPPIVIVYLVDCLGAKHLDLYGYSRSTAPTVTALARGGAWFRNMFANSPRTVESVADIMLSRPAAQHRVTHPLAAADPQFVSLAEMMHAAGFATVSFCTNVNAGRATNMDQGFATFVDRIAYWWTEEADRTVPIQQVLEWTQSHRDRPQFIYIHTAEPHSPYILPRGAGRSFDTGYRGKINGSHDRERGFRKAQTPKEINHVISLFDDEVLYAGKRLGQFLEALRKKGVTENLHLFVTADHGEEFLEHGHWEHGMDLHNELLRVPLLASGPMVSARGRIDAGAQLLDLMPTILDMFDIPPPYPLAGRSLLPLLRGDTGAPAQFRDRTIFSSNYRFEKERMVEYSVIEGMRWKFMVRCHESPQEGKSKKHFPSEHLALFDLETDINEEHNLLNRYPGVVRRLVGKLLAYRHRYAPFYSGAGGKSTKLNPRQLRQLRSLGYIGND